MFVADSTTRAYDCRVGAFIPAQVNLSKAVARILKDDFIRRELRILWADDEIDLLKPHLLFWRAKGFHVTAVNGGVEALRKLGLRSLTSFWTSKCGLNG